MDQRDLPLLTVAELAHHIWRNRTFRLHGVPFAEFTVLRVAYAYEQQTPWQRRRPPV